ncbi:UvrD-helicase domain-containing protein [Myxococcus sp. NMCA1]|uniref:UvrD-helicase domain-containing protein n=1 Tax=Myxococcus sp. NMCA1 TaxID=2996785 RepID=UPI0022853B2F|nr:ATP-dependent helicase [Myxococcus sp. NMCA1]WAM23135.1 ATP-dependent helicase [Myxococcus sp. NMCA1]
MSLHRRRIRAEEWSPVGIESLEDNAFDVVRSVDNRSVIAGPGAGKTELLAQRAAYLLQTGGSPRPQRILAISFKRDAAANLASRVRKRCHPRHAARLDSMTFDAFAKSIVDRFGQALPEAWRPRPDYQIFSPTEGQYRDYLGSLGAPPAQFGARAQIMAIKAKDFERKHLFGVPLPEVPYPPENAAQWAADRYWRTSLENTRDNFLSFPMIGRLAELVLRVNQVARQALALTYSHLFLDEFQDTTQIQYDLVRTIFLGSAAIVTAVGDNKQQIMRWAMAMDDPFGVLERDFGAKRTPLLNNYRSSPELVRIQHVLAQALDAQAVAPVSKTQATVSGGSCAVWDFSTPAVEAKTLAAFIASQMKEFSLGPRDFVLLVRQRAVDYAKVLAPALANYGVLLRNEAASVGEVTLQELLAEDLSEMVIGFARLATSTRAGRYWSECQDTLANLRGFSVDDDASWVRLSRELDTFCADFRQNYPKPVTDLPAASTLVAGVLNFIGLKSLLAAFPVYRQGDWMTKVTNAIALHIQASCAMASDWATALDVYEGVNALPLMTIHKSKGLEYHTVIFVGLDDGAWWSFSQDQIEATAGFFVAFTRAKQRVLFTYCPTRGMRQKIATLYELLKLAGVSVIPAG